MKNLKDLTESECIEIAKIARPDIDWVMCKAWEGRPLQAWDGFDLISKNDDGNYIFQIDYRYATHDNSRFRLYKNTNELGIRGDTIHQIYLYLEGLDKKSDTKNENYEIIKSMIDDDEKLNDFLNLFCEISNYRVKNSNNEYKDIVDVDSVIKLLKKLIK